MEDNIEKNVTDICSKQNYDDLLIKIVKPGKDNKINCILNNIYMDKSITDNKKRGIYEKIFDYVDDINKELKSNIESIFASGVREAITEINKKYIERDAE